MRGADTDIVTNDTIKICDRRCTDLRVKMPASPFSTDHFFPENFFAAVLSTLPVRYSCAIPERTCREVYDGFVTEKG